MEELVKTWEMEASHKTRVEVRSVLLRELDLNILLIFRYPCSFTTWQAAKLARMTKCCCFQEFKKI